MTIRMLDPTVESQTPAEAAPEKLTTLDGKVVGLISNGKLNASKVLEYSAEIIRRRFDEAQFLLLEGTIDQSHAMSDELHARHRLDAALVAIGD